MEKVFPFILIVLDLCACVVYAYMGDMRHTFYWFCAAVLTACVTF